MLKIPKKNQFLHLDFVDGGLKFVDLLLEGLFDLLDVLGFVQTWQVFVQAGVVDDDVGLLLVDDLTRLAIGNLKEQTCKTETQEQRLLIFQFWGDNNFKAFSMIKDLTKAIK